MIRSMRWLSVWAMLFAALLCAAPMALADDGVNVMYYMLGSDLEQDSAAASRDILEMLQADTAGDMCVFVLIGGSDTWDIDPRLNRTCSVLMLEQEGFTVVDSLPDTGCATQAMLTRFIDACHEVHPAWRNVIVFWGHGVGGTKGIGYDALADDDVLTLAEIAAGLGNAHVDMDIVGFDACRMATLETVWSLRNECEYIIASAAPESLQGWNQKQVLSALRGTDPTALAEGISTAVRQSLRQTDTQTTVACIQTRPWRDAEQLLSQWFSRTAPCLPGELLTQLCSVTADDALSREVMRLIDGQPIRTGLYSVATMPDAYGLDGIGSAYGSWIERCMMHR